MLETFILSILSFTRKFGKPWVARLVAPHGKKFGTDAAPSGRAVAFTGGELCDYAFGYAAFPLWVSSCPFFGEQLTYVEETQRSFQ